MGYRSTVVGVESLEHRRLLASHTFSNSTFISIDSDFFTPTPATPYPSAIDVSGVSGTIEKVTVTLHGFSHTRPEDVDILLYGPSATVMLMSDAGLNYSVNGRTITFEDDSPEVPDLSQINSGTYRPTNHDGFDDDTFPLPAPFWGASADTLFTFSGGDANATWTLFVVDDGFLNSGSISGGWSLTITTAGTVTPAPSAPVLTSGSDTGEHNNDRITKDTTPTFVGTAVAGSLVTLYVDGFQFASGTAPSGTYNITTPALSNGPHEICATATAGALESPRSAATTVTIDTVRPVLSQRQFTFETGQSLVYGFSEKIASGLSISVQDITKPSPVPPTNLDVTYNAARDGADITFALLPNQSLPDGNYRATLSATDVAGNTMGSQDVMPFYTLAGDANRDRAVDISDLAILATNWQLAPRTFSQGDFNYDGTVDISDLAILATNWQVNLPPPVAVRSPFGLASGRSVRRPADAILSASDETLRPRL